MVGVGGGNGGVASLSPAERLIWSADVEDEAAVLDGVRKMPGLGIIKLDQAFLVGTDLSIIDRINDLGIRVFADVKITEIPSKLEIVAKKYLAHQPWMLNCMAGSVSNRVFRMPPGETDRNLLDGLKRFADACHEVGTRPCGVTVLTSKTDDTCREEFGRDSTIQVSDYGIWLRWAGFTDLVCSKDEVHVARDLLLDSNVPGARLAGSDNQDQARVGTPQEILAAGGTRLVVGRPITSNPAKNWPIWLETVTAAAAAA